MQGGYLAGGKEAGACIVDQRLLPRVTEGEVRMLMVGPALQYLIVKKPAGGGLSAVAGNATYTHHRAGRVEDPELRALEDAFLHTDLPQLKEHLGVRFLHLPLLWSVDYIVKDRDDGKPGDVWVVSEVNCSCVGIPKFQAACGGEKTLADVPDDDFCEASEVSDLIGELVIMRLENHKREQQEAKEKKTLSADEISASLGAIEQ